MPLILNTDTGNRKALTYGIDLQQRDLWNGRITHLDFNEQNGRFYFEKIIIALLNYTTDTKTQRLNVRTFIFVERQRYVLRTRYTF